MRNRSKAGFEIAAPVPRVKVQRDDKMSEQVIDPARFALAYALAGLPVLPLYPVDQNGVCACSKKAACESPGKHPRIGKWRENATTNIEQIQRWIRKWPGSNWAMATGPVCVLDVDGPKGEVALAALIAERGPIPDTFRVKTGRGCHHYFKEIPGVTVDKRDGLDVRGAGGYVVIPGSLHYSGVTYQVDKEGPILDAGEWLTAWFLEGKRAGASQGSGPNQQQVVVSDSFAALGAPPQRLADTGPLASRALAVLSGPPWSAHEEARLRAALSYIPASIDGRTWAGYLGAMHDLRWIVDGVDRGLELFDAWSRTSKGSGEGFGEYKGRADVEKRWISCDNKTIIGPVVTLGSIYSKATECGWPRTYELPAEAPKPSEVNGVSHSFPQFTAPEQNNPLIKLNEKFCVIGDLGGKCLVMSKVPSKVDRAIAVPSFQTCKAFTERFAHQHVKTHGMDEAKPLGAYWLKWGGRRTFEGLDLVPGGEPVLDGNVLNLWCGFGVTPVPGDWSRTQQHIKEVLAGGDPQAAEYIAKFAAWCVQHPGERAEAALVFRGGKGTGKGTFANAMRRVFGQHGMHVANSKHLVGNFNGHLRNCLLLFADEAFWAGDKQGESTLKALITEPVLMIEQKGIDPVQWENRLHVIMAANAEWVVPASHDERRYAMFQVSDCRVGDAAYFAALHEELRNGGLAAMLHDLLLWDLGTWHPRLVLETAALQEQKAQSFKPLEEWWEGMLQTGVMPEEQKFGERKGVSATTLFTTAKDAIPRMREVSLTLFGRFLRAAGAEGFHTWKGNYWKMPELDTARKQWDKKHGKWPWRNERISWEHLGVNSAAIPD